MIVGLGNTGNRYKNTRHNVGFIILESLARHLNIKFRRNLWLRARIARFFDGEEILMLCPSTYMNLSGKSVRKAKDKFSLPLENLLVICDDVNLPFGKLRLRTRGGSGGHRGLLSLIQELGSEDFSRLRIGIGRPFGGKMEEYVLEDFSSSEQEELTKVVDKAEEVVMSWIKVGPEKTMSLFN